MTPPPPQALIKRWLEHVLERRQWSPADPLCLRKPQIVDGQRVVVMGVVTRLVRQRRR